jgi:hypothetical protein
MKRTHSIAAGHQPEAEDREVLIAEAEQTLEKLTLECGEDAAAQVLMQSWGSPAGKPFALFMV